MYTLAQSTLMNALATRDGLVSPRPHDWPVERAQQKTRRRNGRPLKTERMDRPEPYGAQPGWFILGYGKVPGDQESAMRLF